MATAPYPSESLEDFEAAALYVPMRRLTADMRRAAATMGNAEVRYLIDLYYACQESRKRGDNQRRAAGLDQEPNALVSFLADQVEAMEGACNTALMVIARRTRVGRWLMGIKGISGVLTAGLLAAVQIEHAPTAASIWRFAGLDPSWHWLGKEKASKLYTEVREEVSRRATPQDLLPLLAQRVNTPVDGILARVERQTRPRAALQEVRPLDAILDHLTRTQLTKALATRPWNAGLKTLTWKIMDCLVKVQNRDDAPYYCTVYQERKHREWRNNFAGLFHAQCTEALARNLTPLQRPWYSGLYDPAPLMVQWQAGENPSTWTLPEPKDGGVPMLPPGRIELRARRVAVKKFLADLHYCLYEEHYGRLPVPNPAQQARGRTRFRPPDGWAETT